MYKTTHFIQRLSQRGIKHTMIDLVLVFGKPEDDKTILNRKGIDILLGDLERIKKEALTMRERGGVVVVEKNNTLITAYGING